MSRVVPWEQAEGLSVLPEAAPPTEQWALTRPDAVLALVDDGTVTATAGLWWRGPVVGGPAGRIGHARWAGAEAGAELVSAACDRLRAEGAPRALGPMDGSTWFAYRVVSDPAPDGTEPVPLFALEPWPPAPVAEAFEQAGFEPVAHYVSSRVDALPDESAPARADRERLAGAGISVRPLRPGEDDLVALHPLLLGAFADNLFYAPLDLDRFLALYRPLLDVVDRDLVLVAERAGAPVGVVLAMPDVAQARRGEPVDTVIVKTLAVSPAERGQGLGGALVRAVQEVARHKGYARAIHALMHADNASVRISTHLGRPIRRYAVLGRTL